MSKIAALREQEYEDALAYAKAGDVEQALDILWMLRLKVDLSVYRRALVNLTIASILTRDDRTRYAHECLDLLDILRQQRRLPDRPTRPEQTGVNDVVIVPRSTFAVASEEQEGPDEELEHIDDLEAVAREIIHSATEKRSSGPPIDPFSGLLSDPVEHPPMSSPTKSIAGGLHGLKLEPEVPSHDERQQRKVVWESTRTKPPVPTTNLSSLPQIEGFLRDEYYEEFTFVPASKTPKADDHQLEAGARLPTPARSSPPP